MGVSTLKKSFGSGTASKIEADHLFNRTAEISSGVICVCIPTLAPLTRRRRPVRPSHSILQGLSESRKTHLGMKKRQPATSLDERELWGGASEELDLQEPLSTHTRRYSRQGPPDVAVFTGIEGGVGPEGTDGIQVTAGQRELIEAGEGLKRGTGIVATTRIEHIYT